MCAVGVWLGCGCDVVAGWPVWSGDWLPVVCLHRRGCVWIGGRVWLQRCARPTASVARILQHLTRPVLCRACVSVLGRWVVWPLLFAFFPAIKYIIYLLPAQFRDRY